MPKIYNKRTDRNIPKEAFYVARPSQFGNPYSHKKSNLPYVMTVGSPEEAVAKYRVWLDEQIKNGLDISVLKGKDLVCWCDAKVEPCHATVLMELANKKEKQRV